MSESSGRMSDAPAVIIVPCRDGGHVGCEIARRAAALVAAETPEAVVAEAEECPRGGRQFVMAVDGSRGCAASTALEECKVRAAATVSAPGVLARSGLVKPGVDVRGKVEELSAAVAGAIRESLQEVLEEVRERRRYGEEMAPVLKRFAGLWSKVESLPTPPNGELAEAERARVELLARRSRNLFVRFDEVVPPTEWAEPHDLFQDALLCIAYACEGWVASETDRWEQNLEKARVQIKPLLRRLEV